jgi:hypothetical protein
MNKVVRLLCLVTTIFTNSIYAQINIDTNGAAYTPTSSPVISNTALGGSGGTATGLGGTGGVGGMATGGQSSSSGNTSGNTSINSNYSSQKIPVAPAIAAANFPTAPCMGATSVAISGVILGFGAGSSWEAIECMTLEMARSFEQAGMHEDALAIRCTSKYAIAAPSCIKLLNQKVTAKQTTDPIDSNFYSETIDPITGFKMTIDTRESLRRILILK